MLGAIIGDIVGSRFEWNNYRAKDFEFLTYECFPTDDSIMSLALAQAVIISKQDHTDLKDNAVECMQRIGRNYPDCGYGSSFYNWIFSENPKPYNSFGNGAAMRVSAVGFAANSLEEVKEMSRLITEVTHNHPEGIKGAEATAVAIYMARMGSSILEIRDYIDKNYYLMNFTLDSIRDTYQFNETCQDTVPQALMAFFESTGFEDAIRNAISIGGDSDTIAAICGGVAEAYYGIPADIRKHALTFLDEDLLKILTEFENRYPPVMEKKMGNTSVPIERTSERKIEGTNRASVMEAAIAAVDADIADSVLTPEETTSQQLFNHLFEDHTKDNKLCPEHQAFYTDTGEECNLENKKEKRKKEEKMKGHLDIINTIDTQAEKKRNSQIRKKILIMRILKKLSVGVIAEAVIWGIYQLVKRYSIVEYLIGEIMSGQQNSETISKIVGIVALAVMAAAAITIITDILGKETRQITNKDMLLNGSHYTDRYLAMAEELKNGKILKIWSDVQKKESSYVWFKYETENGSVKKFAIELQLVYNRRILHNAVDLDKRSLILRSGDEPDNERVPYYAIRREEMLKEEAKKKARKKTAKSEAKESQDPTEPVVVSELPNDDTLEAKSIMDTDLVMDAVKAASEEGKNVLWSTEDIISQADQTKQTSQVNETDQLCDANEISGSYTKTHTAESIMEGTHTSESLEGTKNVPDTSSLWHQEYNRTENQATEMKQECTSNKMGETNMITGTGTNTEQNNGAAGTLETNTFKTEAGNKNIPAAGNLNQKEQHSCGKEDSPEKEQLTNKAENDYIAPKKWKPLF